MNVNEHMKDALSKSVPEIPLDIIFEAIIKVGNTKKLNKAKLTKRYLRRFFNIDMDSAAIKERFKYIKKQ